MRIAYLVSEFGLWGATGGYGHIARAVASGMAARGHEVFALVPKRSAEARRDRRPSLRVDGVTVVGLPHGYAARLRQRRLYRTPGADLYVSLDARFDSWLAMQAAPRAAHAIWLFDPMPFDAYWSRHREDPRRARPGEKTVTRLAFEGLRVFGRAALRRADVVWRQPQSLPDAARRTLRLRRPTRFAPDPVDLPEAPIAKSPRPRVLFLGRLDWQKQPERFLALARRMPGISFAMAGVAGDRRRERVLRDAARRIPNLELAGFVRGERKEALLRGAWLLCNTSLREGLPHSLREGLAYGCALVARVDPDGLVSRFGARVEGDDFEGAVAGLLQDGRWRSLGGEGRAWVAKHNETGSALDAHEALCRELIR